MSIPPSSLQQRQRLHRRQNSTPVVAFEAMKVSTNMPQPRQSLHRRGQSFDQQRSPIRRHPQGGMVSMTNLGPIHGQQILREAQQQRIVRPGQHHQHPNMHMDMPISPECGMFPATSSQVPVSSYENMTMNAMMHQASQGIDFAHSQQYFADMNMSMQAGVPHMGLMDENNAQYLHDAHSVHSQQSTGISYDNRRMSQPDLRVQTQLRPHTPSSQIQSGESEAFLLRAPSFS